jgi:putative transcriptional regulator
MLGHRIDPCAPEVSMRNKLRVLRAERGWSQAVLAERLQVSRQTTNALETGKYDPSLPLAFKIARIFDQPIEEIFYPDDMDEDSNGIC